MRSLVVPLALLMLGLTGCKTVPSQGAPVDASRLTDGQFTGSAANIDKATVTITVEKQRITAVRIDDFEASPIGAKARDVIPKRIVEQQSTKVDVVSGATEGSNVIMNAANAAVAKSYAANAPGR